MTMNSNNAQTWIDRSIMGELMLGELSRWTAGVCLITAEREGSHKGVYEEIYGGVHTEPPDRIRVRGERGTITRIDLPADPAEATEEINRAISQEMSEL